MEGIMDKLAVSAAWPKGWVIGLSTPACGKIDLALAGDCFWQIDHCTSHFISYYYGQRVADTDWKSLSAVVPHSESSMLNNSPAGFEKLLYPGIEVHSSTTEFISLSSK